MRFLELTPGQMLSYEKRFEIASRLCEALCSLYQDRIVMLSDTRALRLAKMIGIFNIFQRKVDYAAITLASLRACLTGLS